jgi:hypothetical protein
MNLSDFIDKLINLESDYKGKYNIRGPVEIPVVVCDTRSGVAEVLYDAGCLREDNEDYIGGSVCDLPKNTRFVEIGYG